MEWERSMDLSHSLIHTHPRSCTGVHAHTATQGVHVDTELNTQPHTGGTAIEQIGVQYLSPRTRPGEAGLTQTTLQLLDDPLYHLSHTDVTVKSSAFFGDCSHFNR